MQYYVGRSKTNFAKRASEKIENLVNQLLVWKRTRNLINTFYFSIEGYVTVETLTNSFFPVNYSTCVFGYRPVILTDNCKINNVLIIKLIGYLGEYMRLFWITTIPLELIIMELSFGKKKKIQAQQQKISWSNWRIF